MAKYKIAIVDDHKIFRDGFKMVLDSFEFVDTVMEATNGNEFLELIKKEKPDVVFMDINMPVMNGIESTEKGLKKDPKMKIIALTSYDYIEYINKILHAGVVGYMLKDADYDEIGKAIKEVMAGKNYFSQKILDKLTKDTVRKSEEEKIKQKMPRLTKRENEILKLICKGYSKTEIAEKLFISERTVEKHKENIMTKTDTNSTINLVLFAIKNNLAKV